jgi:hypothetical protein
MATGCLKNNPPPEPCQHEWKIKDEGFMCTSYRCTKCGAGCDDMGTSC